MLTRECQGVEKRIPAPQCNQRKPSRRQCSQTAGRHSRQGSYRKKGERRVTHARRQKGC